MTIEDLENKEVTWDVQGATVAATITAPIGKGPRAAVVLVAGSGPTDRDWCTPLLPGTNGSARSLAEALASRGFATIRYDKIAAGPNANENLAKFTGKMSMRSHVEELRGAVEALLSESDVDAARIFALTNSEGALHAVNYQLEATDHRFRGMVLTGAPGRAVGTVARVQIAEQVRSLPDHEGIMEGFDAAIADFLADRPMVFDPCLPDILKQVLQALELPINLPFTRELWGYDLPEQLRKVEEPVLVVIGKKDLQIDWRIDGGALERAIGDKDDVSFVYPDDADHVLKHEATPRESITGQMAAVHYNASDSRLDPGARDAILKWLDDRS